MKNSKHTLLFIFFFIELIFGNQIRNNIRLFDDLKNFKKFVGKTFIGNIENKNNDSIGHEIIKWELALKGDAIKIYQHINENELVGESIIMFDQATNQFSCWYFSSGGVSKKSKVIVNGEQIILIEDVSKNNNSITKIRTKYEFIKSDSYIKNTQFLINNVWTKGLEINYKELIK